MAEESIIIETYSKIIERITNQKEILDHVVERLDSLIGTTSSTNEKIYHSIDNLGHNIPERIKECLSNCNNEVVKAIEELGNRIKTLKEGSDSGFVESVKEIEKMKNRINFLYAAFAIVVMQLIAILLKIWF